MSLNWIAWLYESVSDMIQHFFQGFNVRLRGILHMTYPAFICKLRLFFASTYKSGFNSKLAYKIRKDRNPTLIEFADKFAVRDFVENRVGARYLPKLYFSGKDTFKILGMNLPTEYVVKPNHACGAIVIVSDTSHGLIPKKNRNWGWQSYSTNSSVLNRKDLVDLCDYWLTRSFYYEPFKFPEWAYKNIKPKILIEELLVGWNSEPPIDYKFFVFDGKCKMVFVVSQRFKQPKADLFNRDWKKLMGTYVFPPSEHEIEKPPHFEEMIKVAETLGTGIDFVRVDLYATASGVKFSELTNYPAAAMKKIRPRSLDKWLGENWVQNY